MRILVWNECYSSGGADWSLIDLVSHWPEQADSFSICINRTHEGFGLIAEKTRARAQTLGFESLRERAARLRAGPLGRLGAIGRGASVGAALLSCVWRYWTLLDPSRFDVLLMNNGGYPGGTSNFLAAALAALRGVPRRVMIVRNYPQGRVEDSLLLRLCRICVALTTHHVVAVSDSLKRALEDDGGLPAGKVLRIYNGVSMENKGSAQGEARPLSPAGGDRFTVGIIGTFEPRKGHEVLFHAWARVIERVPRARLIVAGSRASDPENRDRLGALARSLGIDGTVSWVDFVREVGRLYEELDVVVMPSLRYESFGRIVVEAMAFRRLIVASRSGGIPELVAHGEDGWLFEPGDHEELARLLIRAAERPEERRETAERGRRKYEERFTAEAMARAYRGLLGKG